mmetsp:Transcript_93092/g.262878  ORF Transcript_93092/g.262878 Transcript_93092/m.262878 type:complete len:279 (-) Transcript_93092:1292-2128(-)
MLFWPPLHASQPRGHWDSTLVGIRSRCCHRRRCRSSPPCVNSKPAMAGRPKYGESGVSVASELVFSARDACASALKAGESGVTVASELVLSAALAREPSAVPTISSTREQSSSKRRSHSTRNSSARLSNWSRVWRRSILSASVQASTAPSVARAWGPEPSPAAAGGSMHAASEREACRRDNSLAVSACAWTSSLTRSSRAATRISSAATLRTHISMVPPWPLGSFDGGSRLAKLAFASCPPLPVESCNVATDSVESMPAQRSARNCSMLRSTFRRPDA